MSPGWVGFICGLIVGTFAGVFILGLLVSGGQHERERRIYERARQDLQQTIPGKEYGG